MADEPSRRPLLNPVLRFTKDPRPEGITAGGKNASGIKTDRLASQRRSLSTQFRALSARASRAPRFNDRAVVYASMFDDSLAATWTPSDLFQSDRGARLIAPFRSGYIVEIDTAQLEYFAALVVAADGARDKVDISRVESVRFYEAADAVGNKALDEVWEHAPETGGGRAFLIWLMPLRDRNASEHLLQTFASLRDGTIVAPPPLLAAMQTAEVQGSVAVRRGLRTIAASGDRLNLAMREYRQKRRSKTTVIVPTRKALDQLVASGAVFRIEPVMSIHSTSPGEGREPDRPLPSDMSKQPIVGVVDGGMTAASYKAAEAWKAPPLVSDAVADTKHGNRVSSLIVQAHDWNNNLALPSLYCQIGTVQAVAKSGSTAYIDPQDFIAYLDLIMASNPDTKVWNLSLNQKQSCLFDSVSFLGHEIALLARKHGVVPIISVGNKPGDRLQPPADCEAAITIGGRMHNEEGAPGGRCPVSHSGPGPSSMLKPELAHFSHVRALGGALIKGSSFATAITSPLAAHTMERLRDPSPDLVKALLMHSADGDSYDPSFGFGTPGTTLPWDCRPGFVTLQWTASLRPGAAYYWELPIPQALRDKKKLRGHGTLTAIINPHPLVTDYAGPNYFSARLATALQYQRGGRFHNLLGSLDTDKIAEQQARAVDHKWSPTRHHKKEFKKVSFDGDILRVYARVYTRDLYLYDYKTADETPELNTVFVLSLGTGNESDDIYNQLRNQLGAFVETATIDADIDVENDGGAR